MRLVVVSGMSGAGKTQALHDLEDLGYFCVDNLPAQLLPSFVELALRAEEGIPRAALGIDVRAGGLFDAERVLEAIRNVPEWADATVELLYMDCADDVLLSRYKESRRDHPLSREGSLDAGIRKERQRIMPLKEAADYIINTEGMRTQNLRRELARLFSEGDASGMKVQVMSFGFKHGAPADADVMMDVRFLPNPYYVPELRPQTGLDAPVRDYVLGSEDTRAFLAKFYDMLEYLLPRYVQEGKSRLVIAIGCTGGMHRSVAIAQATCDHLVGAGYQASASHRDAQR